MKIAITFLLLGLVGSASSFLRLGSVTNAVSLANLAADLLASCNAAWEPCDCARSNEDLLEDVTGVLNSLRAFVIRLLQKLGCTLDELLVKMNLDAQLKGLIRTGCETGDWGDFITTYGHSAQTVVTCLVQTVLNLVNSLVPGLDAEISKALVTLGGTLDAGVLVTVLPCGLHSLIGLLNTAGVVTGAVLGPVAALLGLFG
ncbi:uncharacterized protein O3C94_001713 [Discoglossus pictus]